jgi:hypothetical protein
MQHTICLKQPAVEACTPEVVIATGALAGGHRPPVSRRQLHVLLCELLRALCACQPHLLYQRLGLLLLLFLQAQASCCCC